MVAGLIYCTKYNRKLMKELYDNQSSAVGETGDRLATIDMAEKWGLVCRFPWGVGLHLTLCGLGRDINLPPYQVAFWSIQPFGHNTPTLQTGQTDRQRYDSTGRTVYTNGRPRINKSGCSSAVNRYVDFPNYKPPNSIYSECVGHQCSVWMWWRPLHHVNVVLIGHGDTRWVTTFVALMETNHTNCSVIIILITRHRASTSIILANILRSLFVARTPSEEARSPGRRSNVENAPPRRRPITGQPATPTFHIRRAILRTQPVPRLQIRPTVHN